VPISVDFNELTGRLNYLESTLTKTGRGAVMVIHPDRGGK
jgi:hypothetical protein